MSEERWPLPSTWRWRKAGEIAQIVGGGTPPASDEENFDEGGTPWITPADLTGYQGVYIARGRRGLSKKGLSSGGARLLPAGTVLYSSRAPIGYCAIASNPIATNQGFKSLVLSDGFIPEFVRYYLLSSKDYAESLASGTTFKELSGSRIAEMLIPAAPRAEQQRIVSKLDNLLKRSKCAREELTRIPRLIERYKQAIFGAAFRGLLTAEWRLEHAGEITTPTEQVIQDSRARLSEKMGVKPWKPRKYKDYPSLEIPECWRAARVCDVALHRSGVAYKSQRFGASGTQVVRLGNLYQGRLDLGRSPVFIAEPTPEDGAFAAKAGDILVSQTGTRYKRDYGNCVLLNSDDQEVFVNQRILCLSPTESVLPKFLAYYGNTPDFRNFFFNQETGGVNQGNVGVGGVMDVPCPLPSLAEQREIVHRVDAAIGIVDGILADVTRALTLVERLDHSTLAKAFRGELVEPQRTVETKMVISQ